jgi:hypothetical protein
LAAVEGREDQMKYSGRIRTAAAAVLAVALAALPAAAKNGSGTAKVKPVKATSASVKPTSAGPKAKAPKAQAPKGNAQTAKPTVATTTKSSTKSAAKTKDFSGNANRSGDGTPATSLEDFADNRPTTTNVPLSKAQQKLASNPKLREKMQLRLGRDPMAAAAGFKNLGQFVAAVNVSNNLGIDFDMLKTLMVRRGMSLGQAIQQAKAIEARRATSLANTAVAQADDEITATSLVSVTRGTPETDSRKPSKATRKPTVTATSIEDN